MITLKIHKHYTSNDLLSVLETRRSHESRSREITISSEDEKRTEDLEQAVEVEIP